ncbi:hypothetical protein TL16_g10069 [Triparma laevis f. inornata]|uniref:Uncharacterized protein n=2 Tax=Triparma laevis TaxID=1534972 RepID=A0A9W7AZ76_9STRA|nr:hypothetical protein TrLO_g9102 [Triparma laevis f. longispina]GMH84921.1 hypothetical protein TL16_g10069 [Triparma laevis f. inornata]
MSKSVVSESNKGHENLKMSGKRGAGDEGGENGMGFVEVPPAESLSISTTVSTAPPSWITKLRKPELRAELSDRSVKFEKKDNKSVLIELLCLRLLYENRVLGGNNFLNTDDFRRILVPFLPNDTLMTIRLVSKPWSHVADRLIDEGVRKGELIVHDGKDINYEVGLA